MSHSSKAQTIFNIRSCYYSHWQSCHINKVNGSFFIVLTHTRGLHAALNKEALPADSDVITAIGLDNLRSKLAKISLQAKK